ncbi:MAG: DUF2924 domain-containing protein [Candidatus Gastranaerophilales bacterium]|nr:DUF2924 domain-containing protein [Candidatus Gastranaerophilales bacterium]
MIQELQNLSREELIKNWYKVFKTEPSAHAKTTFLIQHLSWELQAKKYGGLSASAKKKLEKIAAELAQNKQISIENISTSQNIEIKAGTKLIREYQGRKHEVIALEKGFEYNNKTYKSLSAIANEITGTRWNGKVFFGVKK